MVLSPLAKKRAYYQQHIWTYEKRREAMRIKYKVISNTFPPQKASPAYHKAVRNINNKIKQWNKAIKEIDILSNKLIALGNAVATFTGCNIKGSGKNMRDNKDYDRMKLAKSLFYKYGLESGIGNIHLRQYVGAKKPSQPGDYRRAFNRLFENTYDARDTWIAFNKHFKSTIATSDTFIDNRKALG